MSVCILFSLLETVNAGSRNRKFQSFNKAKKALLNQVYYDHPFTFYCGCKFSKRKNITDYNGYTPKKIGKRSKRIEIEHVVPAHSFGQSFKEWREPKKQAECKKKDDTFLSGRDCAAKLVLKYRYMEADLYNLVPAVGELNNLRSNYSFSMIPGGADQFGKCKVQIRNQKIEPPPNIRGNIARIYMYMNQAYPGHRIISGKNRKLFMAWDKQDPVDEWECTRCKRIQSAKIQGNYNPIVKKRCLQRNLWK